jgi:uncharacterized protein
MINFKTKSGSIYAYDRKSNRILFGKQPNIDSLTIEKLEEDYITNFTDFTDFVLEITQKCNFRCSYCCYSGDYVRNRTHENKTMSKDKILETLDFIGQHKHKEKTVAICFYGGEALLAQKEIKFFIEQAKELFHESFIYSISTNGYNLMPEIIDWICSVPYLSINISLDGNSNMHDVCRKTIDGKNTYAQIIKNLKYFQSKYPEEYNSRISYVSTIPDLKSYITLSDIWKNDEFLKSKLPVSVELVSKQRNSYSLKEKAALLYEALSRYQKQEIDILTNQLLNIVNAVKQRYMFDLESGNIKLNNCFSSLNRCFIDVNGNIAPCQSVCESFRIGNVITGFDYKKTNEYIQHYTNLRNNRCKKCWAFRICKICMLCIDSSEEKLDIFCKNEQEWCFLSLLFLCELAEIDINRKK